MSAIVFVLAVIGGWFLLDLAALVILAWALGRLGRRRG